MQASFAQHDSDTIGVPLHNCGLVEGFESQVSKNNASNAPPAVIVYFLSVYSHPIIDITSYNNDHVKAC